MGYPDISSLICRNLPLPCPREVLPQPVGITLSQCVLIACLFIIRLLELLDVLRAYYPPGTLTGRAGESHSSFISTFIKMCAPMVKHCLCLIKLWWCTFQTWLFLLGGYLKCIFEPSLSSRLETGITIQETGLRTNSYGCWGEGPES